MSVKMACLIILLPFLFLPAYAGNPPLTYLNRILAGSGLETDKSLRRLSGGRILLPDDPANYAIYEKLEAYIRQFDRTAANLEDMASYYRTHEALLGAIIDVLQRIRELALERLNSVLSDSDRDMIDAELGQQYDQIFMTLKQAEFNGKKLFGGLLESQPVVQLIKNPLTNGYHPAYYRLDSIDRLLEFFIGQRAYDGAKLNALELQIKGESVNKQNTAEMQSHGDTEYAGELEALKLNQLKMLVNILMLKHGR